MGLWKINQGPLQTASSATIKMKGHAPFMLFCLGADNHKETQNVQRPRQASSKVFHDQTREADLHQTAAWPTFMKVNANPEKVSRKKRKVGLVKIRMNAENKSGVIPTSALEQIR